MKYQRKLYLSKEFLSIFCPFYFISTILCMRKYNINYNYVENISRKNIVYAALSISAMSGFYHMIMEYSQFSIKTYWNIYNIIYFEYLLNFAGVSIINLYYSTTTVRLLSILFKISKCFYNSSDIQNFKIMSRSLTVTLLLFCVILVLFKLIYDPCWTFFRGIYVSTSVILDLEIIQIILYTHMLTYKTIRWNYNVKNINFENGNDEIALDRELILEEMHDTMSSIYDAWELTLKTSGFSVIISTLLIFTRSIILW